MIKIKTIETLDFAGGDSEIEWNSARFIEKWVRELDELLPKGFVIILDPAMYKSGIRVISRPFPSSGKGQEYDIEEVSEKNFHVLSMEVYGQQRNEKNKPLFEEVSSVKEIVDAMIADISQKMSEYIESISISPRPCTCGSGEPWTTCQADSPYCG